MLFGRVQDAVSQAMKTGFSESKRVAFGVCDLVSGVKLTRGQERMGGSIF